jgi:hypothetical protein
MNLTDLKADLNKAARAGAVAFSKGIVRAPAADVEFSYFVKKYSTADWSRTKDLTLLMTAWLNGWDNENLK